MTEEHLALQLAQLALDQDAMLRAYLIITHKATEKEGLQVTLQRAFSRLGAQYAASHAGRMIEVTEGRKKGAYTLAHNAARAAHKLHDTSQFWIDVPLPRHLANTVQFVHKWHGEQVGEVFAAWVHRYLEHLAGDMQLRQQPIIGE